MKFQVLLGLDAHLSNLIFDLLNLIHLSLQIYPILFTITSIFLMIYLTVKLD
jgi:hypothetical protein